MSSIQSNVNTAIKILLNILRRIFHPLFYRVKRPEPMR